jgi:hypothetical protein
MAAEREALVSLIFPGSHDVCQLRGTWTEQVPDDFDHNYTLKFDTGQVLRVSLSRDRVFEGPQPSNPTLYYGVPEHEPEGEMLAVAIPSIAFETLSEAARRNGEVRVQLTTGQGGYLEADIR